MKEGSSSESFLLPEDLVHLTRRSLFLVIDSDNSTAFNKLHVSGAVGGGMVFLGGGAGLGPQAGKGLGQGQDGEDSDCIDSDNSTAFKKLQASQGLRVGGGRCSAESSAFQQAKSNAYACNH